MSTALTWFVFTTLAVTAIIHAYWALGGLWPGTDERSLARTVVGATGIEKMPPRIVTGLVSIGIILAAIWPMLWLNWIATPLPYWVIAAGMIVLTLIFLGRGIGGFTTLFKRMNSEEPFMSLDKRYFSPLITALGFAMTYLLVIPWITT